MSTFSIDVDTASYSLARRYIESGSLPPEGMVRVEEMLNYFDYGYAPPAPGEGPFAARVAVAPSPFHEGRKLVRIGLKGAEPTVGRPALNLVFLVDVSGSMSSPDKLPLAVRSLAMLADTLGPRDRVSIVTYAGHSAVALRPTPGDRTAEIHAALASLSTGGGTAGAAGLSTAYAMARENFDADASNRVVLVTDGDFNVGLSDPRGLESYVAEQRRGGVGLTVLGFGTGNYDDATMQSLAQKGNGVAAYIDGLAEARRVLVDGAAGSLVTIASDVKVQVEFNPAAVSEYRLIGYETRALAREDFNDDRVDAGDIGAGHSVTALYEIVPAGVMPSTDPLRYGEGTSPARAVPAPSDEYAFVKLRWKDPGQSESRLASTPVTRADEVASLDGADEAFRFAAAVAGAGELLAGAPGGAMGWDRVIALADGARGRDADGARAEFVGLARDASAISALPRVGGPGYRGPIPPAELPTRDGSRF